MSSKLMFSAAASTLAMAALALGAPGMKQDTRHGAGSSPIEAGLPAPSYSLLYMLPR